MLRAIGWLAILFCCGMRFVIQQTRNPYSAVATFAVKQVTYLTVSSYGKSNKGIVFRDNGVSKLQYTGLPGTSY
jgi:hypothetical protein